MADINKDELERKKRELEEELQDIQYELDDSIDRIKDEVNYKLNPKNLIRDYPLPIVGVSALLGFLMGHSRKKSYSDYSDSSSDFGSTLMYELKRLGTKKAIGLLVDFLEQQFDDKTADAFDGVNGAAEE